MQKQLELDDFIARQLTATGYIATATVEYLKCLFENEHDVLGLKGQVTAELRRQWGLNGLLRNDEVDMKTRDDHRHHAVDALVIALTDRSRLHSLSRIRRGGGTLATGEVLEYPWEGFRNDAVARIGMLDGGVDEHGQRRAVSHRVQRKVAGALHAETVYGPVHDAQGARVGGKFVFRKAVDALSPNEVDKIRDPVIRRIVMARLEAHGVEFGRAKKPDPGKWRAALGNPQEPLTMPSGVPIRRVRLIKEDLTIQPIRDQRPGQGPGGGAVAWVKPDSTHHLCIFEFTGNGKTKRDAVFVSQLEAMNRLKRQQQELGRRMERWRGEGLDRHEIKRRQARAMAEIAAMHPLIVRDASRLVGSDRQRIPPNAKFVMSLAQGELVLAEWKGQQKLLRYRTAASTQGQIYFAAHTDSRKSSDYEKHAVKANTLVARKVTVDPLGRVRWAND